MKIVIFAGGVGKRLWPLSRPSMPKQFQKLFGNETSLENSYNTIKRAFNPEDIFISTNKEYVEHVFQVIPELPRDHVIVEPATRDTAAAVAFAALHIQEKYPNEPLVVRWQNSLIKNSEKFVEALNYANKLFLQGKSELIYLGVPAKYANTGVGYIELETKVEESGSCKLHNFAGFREKPNSEVAESYVRAGNYTWNPGCYITTATYLLNKLEQVSPDFYKHVEEMKQALASNNVEEQLLNAFNKIEKKSIDYVLWEKLSPTDAKVVVCDYDWHYVSTWQDLKMALQTNSQENIIDGLVELKDTENSLVYNFDNQKLVTVVGLENIVVVQTKDALLICHGDKAGKVKDLVAGMEENQSLVEFVK